jgi:hypothetical protein
MNRLLLALLLMALAIAGGLALLASDAPDGLEYSMEETGSSGGAPVLASPMAGYEVPLIGNPTARRVLAGLSGTLAVLGLTLGVGWILRRASSRPKADS